MTDWRDLNSQQLQRASDLAALEDIYSQKWAHAHALIAAAALGRDVLHGEAS